MSRKFNLYTKEADLVRVQMGSAATLLSKSNFADKGRYLQFFFSTSIAIERACKLILMAETDVKGMTDYPNVRRLGHNLNLLIEEVEKLPYNIKLIDEGDDFANSIHNEIIRIINDFSTNRTRYYNLEEIMIENNGSYDPIADWHKNVILKVYDERVKNYKKSKIELMQCL